MSEEYKNINFRKPNMTLVDGCFYFFDDDWDELVQKLDDGSIAFSYPLNSVLSNTVTSVEHDGANFWSMEDIIDGVAIKRWKIENEVVELKNTFNFTPNFDSEAFTVEHYHTALSSGITIGDSSVYLDGYVATISGGIVLSLGPNSLKQIEDVTVSSVSGSLVTLVSGTQYSYDQGNNVSFYNNIWLFNSYSDGALHKIDAYTGINIVTHSGTEYDDITACTFARAKGVVSSRVDALVYEKDTNLKFLNINTMTLYDTMTMDNFQPPSTNLKIYDLSIDSTNVYRLQKNARYYESNYSWSTYNYVLSTTRRFIDTISVSAYPVILPANGTNVTEIKALVNDQYGDGVYNKPVSFTDDDSVGFMTINPAYTDYFFGTGEAVSYYRAGVTARTVNIEGEATQYD